MFTLVFDLQHIFREVHGSNVLVSVDRFPGDAGFPRYEAPGFPSYEAPSAPLPDGVEA
jgi:hypothetical protein